MKKAGDILKGTINRLGLDSKIKSYQIWYIWDKAVGIHISSVAQPEDIKSKILFVNVRDNVWLRQLKFLETMIIDKLNETIGEKVIKKIYFKLGAVGSRESRVVSQDLKIGNRGIDSRLPTTDHRLLADIDLSSINDTDLKETIQRIILKAAAAERA